MSKYTMIFSRKKCIGCNACVVSCQQNYNMPPENKLNWVTVEESGEFPNLKLDFIPQLCAHCDNPECVDVCPVEDATFKTEEGYVLMNGENCIGCRACVSACPYGARSMNAETNVAVKCSFCANLVENDGHPICATTCPTGARIFGDADDPTSEVAQLIASGNVIRYDEFLDNDTERFRPNVYYLKEDSDA